MNRNIRIHMMSHNSIDSLPYDRILSANVNSNHDPVFRYKSYKKDKLGKRGKKILHRCYAWLKHFSFNISARQDLSLPNNQIVAFKPPFFIA